MAMGVFIGAMVVYVARPKVVESAVIFGITTTAILLPDIDEPRSKIGRRYPVISFIRVCQVFCVSFKKIFWGGEPPHLYHPTLLNDTLLKCFGNISNRVSCQ